jgi:hypothetical protein
MTERPSTSSEPPARRSVRARRWGATAIGAAVLGLTSCTQGDAPSTKGTPDFVGSGGGATDARPSTDGSVPGDARAEHGGAASDARARDGGGSGDARAPDAAPWDTGVRSLRPLCVRSDWPLGSLDVWADARGPYALVSASSGSSLYHLENDAWTSIWSYPGGAYGDVVVGFPNGGDFLISGNYSCSSLRLHDGATTCELTNGEQRPAIVSSTLAYSLSHDRVLVFDGLGWTQYQNALGTRPLEVQPWSVWASEDVVAVTSIEGGLFISRASGPFVERTGLLFDSYRVVWGLGNRLWVGGRGGSLFSLDGNQLTAGPSVLDGCSKGIRGLWGTGDTLYIRTEHGVFRLDGDGLSTLHEYACDETVTGFWGMPAQAPDSGAPPPPPTLYVGVKKENTTTPACGVVRIDVF